MILQLNGDDGKFADRWSLGTLEGGTAKHSAAQWKDPVLLVKFPHHVPFLTHGGWVRLPSNRHTVGLQQGNDARLLRSRPGLLMTKLEKTEKLPILLLERILLQPVPWFLQPEQVHVSMFVFFCSVLQFSKTWLDSKKTWMCPFPAKVSMIGPENSAPQGFNCF